MFKLLIADDEGKTTVVPLVRDEVTIGRKEGNTIRLTERNVSRKHAKLRKANGAFYVLDLQSYNGVRVNGRRIAEEVALNAGDQLVIGDYQLTLQFEASEQPEPSPVGEASPSFREPARDAGPPARLVMLSPPAPGAEYAISASGLRIGRNETLSAWVNHRSISREHAEITQEGGEFVIRDLESANGMRVNGAETRRATIRSGDVIELGQVRFRMVGQGEQFVFDAERTMQMDALTLEPTPNRTPRYVAAAIIGLGLLVGVVIIFVSSGHESTPQVTPIDPVGGGPTIASADPPPSVPPSTLATSAGAAPAANVDAQVQAAVSACNVALNSGNFANAVARANEALALRPGDPQASECLRAANQSEAEDSVFLAGQAALRQNDPARAVETFSQLPAQSRYLDRPEVADARAAYARQLLAEARGASDPAEAAALAARALALPGLDRATIQEAQTIQRSARTPPVVVARVDRIDRADRGRRDRPERSTPSSSPERPSAGASVAASPAATSAPSPDEQAEICLRNDQPDCVIRLLNGRARTARQLSMLAAAQRRLTGAQSACPTISRLIEQFPSSGEARAARQFHVAQCQGR